MRNPMYRISIHAAREGGDVETQAGGFTCKISIHAAREGGDLSVHCVSVRQPLISIHAAREGGDDKLINACNFVTISIHAAREGGDHGIRHTAFLFKISIHAAREGGDTATAERSPHYGHFNPRRP